MIPGGALSSDEVNLALDEFVPDFPQSWEVWILLLVHHEDNSSDGGR